MKRAYPSSEQVHDWWTRMQSMQASTVYAVSDRGIYRLRAFTDNNKKCGELSLGLQDKRLAQRIADSLETVLDDNSPASVINHYIELKLRHAKTCRDGKLSHAVLAESTEHSIMTIKSRLNAHLIPFCRRHNISNINDLFRHEIIRSYMDELYQTIAVGDTARSVMATTLTMMKWYDGKVNATALMDSRFKDVIKDWRSFFGFKRSQPKVFLSPEQIQSILRYNYTNDRIKALFYFPLICGLRYNEFVNLKWRDLDAKNANMDVMVAKGGTTRKAQYPKVMQNFLKDVRKSRATGILDGDHIFRGYNRSKDLVIYKSLLKEIANIEGKDAASNCLRRSGCNLIDRYQHGLGDRQLGHSICSRITQRSYINNDDYSDVNFFWDTFHAICMEPDSIVGIDRIRQMAMRPENVIDMFQTAKKAM